MTEADDPAFAAWLPMLLKEPVTARARETAARLLRGEADTEALAAACIEHGLGCRALEWLRRLGEGSVPDRLLRRLEAHRRHQQAWALTLLGLLERLGDALGARGVDFLVFKGPALSMQLYGEATRREYADLDLLVRPAQRAAAGEVLAALGFDSPDRRLPRGAALTLRSGCSVTYYGAHGEIVDLHWDLAEAGCRFDLVRTGLWVRRVPVEIRGRGYETFGPEDTLVYLGMHGGKHAWANACWVGDLARFLVCMPALDEALTMRLARECGAVRMLHVGLLLARDLAGGTLPAVLGASARADRAARALAAVFAKRLGQGLPGKTPPLESLTLHARLRERTRDRVVDLVGTLLDAARPRPVEGAPARHTVLGVVTRVLHLARKHRRAFLPGKGK